MRLAIMEALDSLRPMLQADGGDIEFVDYFNRAVYVRLTGACEGCPHANLTIQNGVEAKLIELFPDDVRRVCDVTFDDPGNA